MKPRGFAIPSMTTILVGLGLVAALAATVVGFLAWHAATHFKRGEASKQLEWNRAKLAAIAAGQARDQDVSDAIKEKDAQRTAANTKAASAEAKWEEARRANRKATLGSCEPAAPDERPVGAAGEPASAPGTGLRAPGSGAGDPARAPGVRLRWRFVGLHDGAFTGIDGEPLYAAASQYALDAARADAHSPYGLDDVVDVSGANAKALSTCRRAYFDLRGKLAAAEEAWDKREQK